MIIENINTGICHRRIQTGETPYFVNWKQDGENKYFFGMRFSVENVKNKLVKIATKKEIKQ